MCHPKVPCCVDYKNRKCIKTTEDTTYHDGKCYCKNEKDKIDKNGQCHPCLVDACG